MRKKLMALVLAGVMVLSLAACGGSGGNDGDTNDGKDAETNAGGNEEEKPGENASVASDETVTIALPAEPATMMHVAAQPSNDTITILGYLCDRLVDYDTETGEILPMLATEWEYTDETHIKFTLRDDVTFVDGSKFTAKDAYYTFDTAVELVPTTDLGLYIDMDETEAVDDTTFVLGLSQPLPDFLISLAETGFSIISESAVEAAGGLDAANTQNPNVGSGKYVLNEWAQGEYMLLERNEEYWDADWTGYYKYVKFIFVNDSASRIMSVESGDAQVAAEVPLNQAQPLQGNDGIDVMTFNDGSIAQIYFNCTGGVSKIFNDKAVREAAYMAIDKNAINQVLTAGTGELAQGVISPQNEFYTQVIDDIEKEVDVEGAKKVLEDAGYTGTLQARAVCLQGYLDVMTIVQENLRQIGIELEVDTLDTPQYVTEARAGEYDVVYGTSTMPVRNATLFCLFDTTQYAELIGGPKYGNEALDAQIYTAKTSTVKEEATAAFEYVLSEITSEYTFVGISRLDKGFVTDSNLRGVKFWQRGMVDVTEAYPAN